MKKEVLDKLCNNYIKILETCNNEKTQNIECKLIKNLYENCLIFKKQKEKQLNVKN
jgi:hypothetical protein|tara:strand:+ start:27 stop:194 length:168 start_codon:yes stop_codon:yes gene_type:complete